MNTSNFTNVPDDNEGMVEIADAIRSDIRTSKRAELRDIIIRNRDWKTDEILEAKSEFLDELRSKLGYERYLATIVAESVLLSRSREICRELLLNGTPPLVAADKTFLPLAEVKIQQKRVFTDLAREILQNPAVITDKGGYGISREAAEELLAAHDGDIEAVTEDLWVILWTHRHIGYINSRPDNGEYSFALPADNWKTAAIIAGFQLHNNGSYRQYEPHLGVFLDPPTVATNNNSDHRFY